MTEIYRLTDPNYRTRNGIQWGPGVTHVIDKGRRNPKLCSDGVFHAYRTPLLAAFMRPAHCPGYNTLWRSETPEIVVDDGAKAGVYEATTLEIVELPRPTTTQCVRFGILAALAICDDPVFTEWAERWLSGQDRSRWSAMATAMATMTVRLPVSSVARSAAWAAAWAKTDAEAEAARAADAAAANRGIDLATIAERAMEGDN